MVRTGVVEGANGGDRVIGGASRGDVAELAAVLTLQLPVGRVGPFDGV